jgi:hypothetical protein
MLPKLNIDLSQTPEKFQHLADEILAFLIDKLRELHALEQEIFERYEVAKGKRTESHQTQPEEEELWAEYARRSEEIIVPISLKPYKGNSRSFGKPSKYEYLNYADTKIIFSMKSANRVVVETEFGYGIQKKEQFILKKGKEGWKIDAKKYSFADGDTWWKCEV